MSEGIAGLSGERIDQVFPFYVALDGDMRITSMGSSLRRICPELAEGDSWGERFQLLRPKVADPCLRLLADKESTPFVFGVMAGKLTLRGQLLVERDHSAAMFIGMPWITRVEDIREIGVRIADFPVHSPLADLLFVIQNQQGSLEEARELAERLRRNQQVLARAKEDAEAAAVAKDVFLANISHEIRTPLNGITGVTKLLSGTKLSDDQLEYTDLIERSSKSLLSVLENVLELAQIRSGRAEVKSEPFRPVEVLKEVVDMYSVAARTKNIELRQLVGQGLPGVIYGDGSRVRQVLGNLVGNAIKFTERGSVTIEAFVEELGEHEDHVLDIRVTDTGVGIPEESLERIFDEFVQVDDSATRRFGGNGLGLSICRRLVRLMSGNIEVQSVENQGATFRLRIPTQVVERDATPEELASAQAEVPGPVELLERARVTEGRPADPKSIPLAPSGARLLVVEDNAVNQLVAKRLLSKLGYVVDCASDGVEAVASARGQRYDLVLMDLQMPRMDGFEATRHIRALGSNGSDVPIIALTANALPEHRDRCLADGMDDFVSKPFEFEALAGTIANWIGARRTQKG